VKPKGPDIRILKIWQRWAIFKGSLKELPKSHLIPMLIFGAGVTSPYFPICPEKVLLLLKFA
jgi:hypothetical protein